MFNVFLQPHVHRWLWIWIFLTLVECNYILIWVQGHTLVSSAAIGRSLHSIFIQLSLQHTITYYKESWWCNNHVPFFDFLCLWSRFKGKANSMSNRGPQHVKGRNALRKPIIRMKLTVTLFLAHTCIKQNGLLLVRFRPYSAHQNKV